MSVRIAWLCQDLRRRIAHRRSGNRRSLAHAVVTSGLDVSSR